MEMTYHPKCMEIKGDFFVVYPPEEVVEAREAERKGWDVLIEYRSEKSGNVILMDIPTFLADTPVTEGEE